MLKYAPRASLFGILPVLCGCAQKSAPPALTSISSHNCTATADFSHATAITFDGKKELVLKGDITDASPCMTSGTGAGLYVAYGLPQTDTPYVISIISEAQGDTLMVPRVYTLAPDGAVKREFSGDKVSFRGNGMGLIIRSHPDEAYLVVASDPDAAGKTNSRIEEATQVAYGATGHGSFQIHTGTDTKRTFNLSYNGHVEITLTPLGSGK